jgi:hypothetical protein
VTYGLPYEEGYALSTLNELVRQLNFRLKDSAAFIGALLGDVLKYSQNIERAKQLGRHFLALRTRERGRSLNVLTVLAIWLNSDPKCIFFIQA